MGLINGRTQAETRRTDQRRNGDNAPDGDLQPGCLGESHAAKGGEVGTDYQDRLGRNPIGDGSPSTGGILSQLIDEVENQLGEARACIELYQAKERECLEKLRDLKRIREGVDKSLEPDPKV